MKYNTIAIADKLKRYLNTNFTVGPTPIYKLEKLSNYLNNNIYIMREDLTGFGLGGNKVRKLDYLIGDALSKDADTLLTSKPSSFSRNAAFAGKVYGLDVHIIIPGKEKDHNQASKTLFKQLDAHLYYVPENSDQIIADEYRKVLNKLRKLGRKIYELHPGGSDTIGTLGYINAFNEIVQFSQRNHIHFNKIIHSTGSTATQAGLLLGNEISNYRTQIIGMAASQPADIQIKRILALEEATANMLGIPFDSSKIIVEDGFIGPGYAIPSEGGTQASKIFANMEGIMLDDVYSGKAAAGLIDYALNDKFEDNENILFIHTGGNAGLFY